MKTDKWVKHSNIEKEIDETELHLFQIVRSCVFQIYLEGDKFLSKKYFIEKFGKRRNFIFFQLNHIRSSNI